MTHTHCDRCNAVIESGYYKVTWWSDARPEWAKDEERDLCPECAHDLKKFLLGHATPDRRQP